MVCPILISVSVTPGPYFLSADQAASLAGSVRAPATIIVKNGAMPLLCLLLFDPAYAIALAPAERHYTRSIRGRPSRPAPDRAGIVSFRRRQCYCVCGIEEEQAQEGHCAVFDNDCCWGSNATGERCRLVGRQEIRTWRYRYRDQDRADHRL